MARSEKNLTAVFTDTASAIRAKTGSTEAICPLDFADKINSIQTGGTGGGMKEFIEAGGKFAYSNNTTFDNIIQYSDTENVTDFSYFFYETHNLTDYPNVDFSKATTTNSMFSDSGIVHAGPINTSSNLTYPAAMFYGCSNLKDVQILDMSSVTNTSSMFRNCYALETVEITNIESASNIIFADYMFSECRNISEIPAFDFANLNPNSASGIFSGCRSLKFIHCKNIGFNLYIKSSTLFTREALLEIINNLQTVTSTKKFTMGETNLAKLTDEDKAIATNKGWTLA